MTYSSTFFDEFLHFYHGSISAQCVRNPELFRRIFNELNSALKTRTGVSLRCRSEIPVPESPLLFFPYDIYFTQFKFNVVGQEESGAIMELDFDDIISVDKNNRVYTIPDSWDTSRFIGNRWE